jgi:putative transposase
VVRRVQKPAEGLERHEEQDTDELATGVRKRGLYRASDGRVLNADINGSGNIIRKVAPDAFGLRAVEDGKGVLASLVVHPVRIVVPLTKPKASDS